jgi:F0F1-type ATP synthase assembly protein I
MSHTDDPGPSGSAADRDGMNQGMRVLSHLIAGVLLYGGLGWVGDHFLHTRFLLPVGIVLGAALGIYTTIKRLTTLDPSQTPAAAVRDGRTQGTSTDATEGER